MGTRVLLVVAAALALPAGAAATAGQDPAGNGRVVAIITTLEGTVPLDRVRVELRELPANTLIAITATDSAGQVTFPDVPPGRYAIRAMRAGFEDAQSSLFEVRAGQDASVLLDIQLTFVLPAVEVSADNPSPANSARPVSLGDMLDGTVLETAPLQGDDFQDLLPMLPGVVRGPDGRLRIKGGQPTQGALQVSSASLIDPSTGDFDLELPAPSVESVEVLANPFAAEYGRFSSSVTQIRTRRGTNEWEVKPGNLTPRFRSGLRIRGFEPRLSVRGPIVRDRLFLAQDAQVRYVATPVRSLPDEPDILLRSVDSFTRIDSVLSSRHMLGGGLILFPREVRNATMNTFRTEEASPDLSQAGWSAGLLDRFAIRPNLVAETTLAARSFEIAVGPDAMLPMTYAPSAQTGKFFNSQDRDVGSFQWIESLSVPRVWFGEHVIKVGTDLQWSEFLGTSESRALEIRRLDGTLAERTDFSGSSAQGVRGTYFSVFGQDRWRIGSRVTLEFGFRVDRDAVVQRRNYSPRGGLAVAVLPEGRAIVRGGLGKFVQQTPLNVDAFPSFEPRTVTRYAPDGSVVFTGALANRIGDGLHVPEATVGTLEWDQRFGRRLLIKAGYLQRRGRHEFILTPHPAAGEIRLSSEGASRYREVESTVRYFLGDRVDVTASYVWAKGTADLNNYDQFYGNFRNPILRPNEHNLTPTDVRHRVLIRGSFALPGQWQFAPVAEVRSGFPWSAVNEFQDFVGPRNQAGRLPGVRTFDFQLSRPWRFKKYRFRAGIRAYNIFGSDAGRDIQNNTTAPDFGTAYNPIDRSIGILLGSSR